jgi:phage terminase small subunit
LAKALVSTGAFLFYCNFTIFEPMEQVEPELQDHKLTERQRQFCREYLKDLNALRAARRAGYSEDTAGQIGYELLNSAKFKNVQDAIAELMKGRAESVRVDAAYVLEKLKMISEARIEDYVELRNTVSYTGRGKARKEVISQALVWKDFTTLTEDQKGCIQQMSQTKDGIKIKLYDKSWSLDMIAKHIGLYEKDNAQKEKAGGVAFYIPDNGRDKPKVEQNY